MVTFPEEAFVFLLFQKYYAIPINRQGYLSYSDKLFSRGGGVGEIEGLAKRLQELLRENFSGNVSKFARAAGIPIATMDPLVKGQSLPRADNAVKIAKAARVSLDWLLGGKEPRGTDSAVTIDLRGYDADLPQAPRSAEEGATYGTPAKVDPEVLADVIAGVEIYLNEKGATLEPKKKAEAISLLYDIIIEEEGKAVDQARVAQVLRVAM